MPKMHEVLKYLSQMVTVLIFVASDNKGAAVEHTNRADVMENGNFEPLKRWVGFFASGMWGRSVNYR